MTDVQSTFSEQPWGTRMEESPPINIGVANEVYKADAQQLSIHTPNSSPQGAPTKVAVVTNVLVEPPREPSPAPSSSTSLSSVSTNLLPPTFGFDGAASSIPQRSEDGQPLTKKRKLSPAEKEERKRLKEQKDQERAEARAKKDEEKRIKDEERRQRNEVNEERKRKKDIEKRQQKEEQEKKERAQMRINSFFARPVASSSAPNGPHAIHAKATSDSTLVSADRASITPSSPSNATKLDYDSTFLPFALPAHATLAPSNHFSWDDGATRYVEDHVDNAFRSPRSELPSLVNTLDVLPSKVRLAGPSTKTVKEVVTRITAPASEQASFTTNLNSISSFEELDQFELKFIYFSRDVRPPYIGTYTKVNPTKRIYRNPFLKLRPDTDYQYDSEAEWEEPEEGEDIGSEGESEADTDGDEDMDGFLDDEEVQDMPRKRVLIGDMEPLNSGLRWEGEDGQVQCQQDKATPSRISCKLEMLHAAIKMPIDPFSTSYWESIDVNPVPQPDGRTKIPPKLPLQDQTNFVTNTAGSAFENLGKAKALKGAKQAYRVLTGEDLEEFKAAVLSSELNKGGTLAILKKRLPKVPNDVLKDTLNVVAERVGKKEAEKKWVIREEHVLR